MEKNKTKNEENKEILNPTNDYVFRRIFGEVGNEDITRDLVEKVLKVKYENIDLSKNPILLPETIEGKGSVLDVTIEAEERENINIEMQVARYSYMAERILEYWAKKYSDSFKSGKDYSEGKRTVCILITCFELEQIKGIEELHTKWNIREEKHTEIVLTQKLEFHIINLKRMENKEPEVEKELLNWCKFIINPESLGEEEMEENKNIEKAKKVLEKISQDEKERDLAYRRERAIRDQNAIRQAGYFDGREEGKREGKIEGLKEGKEEGLKEGIKKGRIDEKIDIAKNMLLKNVDIQLISEFTNLTIDEINDIKS